MPTFSHDDIRFHFETRGRGATFVFQHGLGASVDQPLNLFWPPEGWSLLTFDARDHGQTEPPVPADRLGFRFFADDLLALLDHLRVDQAVVGGISMGAGIALEFTARYPLRTRGLVLSRPAWWRGPNPWNVRMFGLISRLIRDHGSKQGQALFRKTSEYLDTFAQWPDAAESLALQFESPQVERTAAKFERIIHDCPASDPQTLAAIRVPTLVLANHRDPIHPYEYAQNLAQAVPGAVLREITPKSVSVPQHEADVRRELENFLTTRFVNPPS